MELTINMGPMLKRFDLAKAIEIYKAAGFTAMDFPLFEMIDDDSAFNGEDYRAVAKAIRATADEKGFPCVQTHAPFSFRLDQWNDPKTFEGVVFPRMVRSIEISAILGAKVIVIHPLHHMVYHGHEEEIFQLNMEYYRRLIPYAAEYGIKIGVENMFQKDPLRNCIVADTCSDVEEFIRYIDTLNSPQITACLDVGHVALPLSDLTAADVIRRLGHERLGALHIHDNDYTRDQHVLPYLGKLDWAEIAKALGEINYEGDFTYEVNGQLITGCDEGFIPIATGFMGAVGKHIVSMIEEKRI
ncbi:MAG: sugar phosphate isomerase/epimerase [Lachnospiraceae bacterium]|nr:sugar phosphate isomerase/epimerase [Lachnospiraceae bacterium]